jgi:hypothetical protein
MERNHERMDDFDRIVDPNPDFSRTADASTAETVIDPKTGDRIGEGVGGVSGAVTGAALGSLGGPIGTVIGGIAGAVAGWWAGREISEAARSFEQHENIFRTLYETSPSRVADRSFDDVRPAYQLGYLAGRNPEYADRPFEDIEPDLQRGWTDDVRARHGEWQAMRGYVREGYTTRHADSDSTPHDRTVATGRAERDLSRSDDATLR